MALIPFEDAKKRRGAKKAADGSGSKGGSRLPPEEDLAGCPVRPLGHGLAKEGGGAGRYFFFKEDGHLIGLTASQVAKSPELVALFGGQGEGMDWLVENFPSKPAGWFSERDAGAWLVAACNRAGIMQPDEPRRGVGVWRGSEGAIVHTGDEVRYYRLEADPREPYKVYRAGFRAEGALWPAQAAVAPPDKPATAHEAREVLLHLNKWHWRTPRGADAFFGLWAAGLLGAAIGWRAHGLVVGPPGSGKSSLLEYYEAASPFASIVNDYTEAGLRQSMSQRAVPIILDEAEGDGTRTLTAVVKLLRRMSGGGGARVLRGSTDGTPQRFDLAAPAMLASVLPPTLEPQDETRITRVDLGPRLPNGESLPSPSDIAAIRAAACSYWSRALAGLARFEHNFALFRSKIIADGGPPRLADQFGTILAARAMMLRDAPLSADAVQNDVVKFFEVGLLRTEEDLAAEQGSALCLIHLLQSAADLHENGERPTIGQLLKRVCGSEADAENASRILMQHGLRVARYPMNDLDGPRCLWVTFSHPRLHQIFADSRWAGGRWHEDLRTVPGAEVPPYPVNIGAKVRAVAVPLSFVLDGLDLAAYR